MKHSIINIKQSILHNALVSTLTYNKMNSNILKLLFKEGLITHYKVVTKKNKNYYRVFLRYYDSSNVIKNIKNIYKARKHISTNNKALSNTKQSILISTSNGLFMQSDKKSYNIGGNAFYFINC